MGRAIEFGGVEKVPVRPLQGVGNRGPPGPAITNEQREDDDPCTLIKGGEERTIEDRDQQNAEQNAGSKEGQPQEWGGNPA